MADAQRSGQGTAGAGRGGRSPRRKQAALGDACSSSPRRPGPGQMPDPQPPRSAPHPTTSRPRISPSLPLPAGLCKQLLRMNGLRLLPAHFPFPALSLSQGSSGKLAERDIFHALDSSARWLSLPPLPPVSSPAGHPDPGEKIFGQLVAAHSLFNFICNFISLGLSFCEMS